MRRTTAAARRRWTPLPPVFIASAANHPRTRRNTTVQRIRCPSAMLTGGTVAGTLASPEM